MSSSIDQVIQSEHSLSAFQRIPRGNDSAVSINKSVPMPHPPQRSASRGPMSPRRDQTIDPLRVSPPGSSSELPGSRSDGDERDHPSTQRTSLKGDDETRRSETLAGTPAGMNVTDFFSSDVFQMVIHNPTTAHRFLKFCQSRACGENMEFLQKVDQYSRAINEVAEILASIHNTYTSADAPRQINLSYAQIQRLSTDIKQTTGLILPGLEGIFAGAQDQIEKLLSSDIYPRFVKHQVTTSATTALVDHRDSRADNPIVFASDGFVSVTGYSRRDIIPRNCRFLQGELTDSRAPKRLRIAIDNCEETVELLLNYRKNGDPFWNLLYVAPLFNETGEVVFFLGGQINCSTTIHSRTDILKVLSVNDEELDQLGELAKNQPRSIRSHNSKQRLTPRSNFFKTFRKHIPSSRMGSKLSVRDEAGMEPGLINRLEKLNFKTQVEAFYTAYSKYLVLSFDPPTQHLIIQHYSPGVIDMLCLNLPNGSIAPIFNKDIFQVLAEYSPASSHVAKAFKTTVRDAISKGRAVSVETGLLTGYEERRERSGFGRMLGDKGAARGLVRVEEKYITHWTPLKDVEGRPKWVVLTIAPKA